MARPDRLYVPLDASYMDDPRVLNVDDLAELLFVRSLALAKRTANSGHLSRRQVERITPPGLADGPAQLVREGLWTDDGDTYCIGSWGRWNGHENGSAEAGKRGNHVRWHLERGVSDPECDLCCSSPDDRGDSGGARSGATRVSVAKQSRAEQSRAEHIGRVSAKPRKNRCKLPDSWPSPEDVPKLKTWAAANTPGLDLNLETHQFMDHHRAKGSLILDWNAAWRTWMRNAVKFGRATPGRKTSSDPDGMDWYY